MTLKTNLLPYQVKAVEKLNKIKIGALYCEMGTGKTRMALELITQRLEANKVECIIWLCPCSVKNNLRLDIIKHVGSVPDNFRIEGIESLSSSIRLNSQLLELVQNKKCYLVVDESNLVKNHKAQRSINIERLSKHCQYKLILNGTPIARNEADLFWQWYILDWRILGYKSFWSFSANHLEYDEYGKICRTLNTDYLTRKIAPYTYQVKKSDVLELPPKVYNTYDTYMTFEQWLEYKRVADEYLFYLDEAKPETIYRLFTVLQHVLSGKRIINKYKDSIQTVKMFNNPRDNPRIQSLLEILGEQKTIIFCKYTDEIKDISQTLSEKYGPDKVVEFYGKVSPKNRIKAIVQFREEANYFIANKTCAGYGLNLQFCSNIVYYSNDWDFATRQQSEDRTHRIGQENEVYITDIVCSSSLDERILECLYRKEKLSDRFKACIERMKDKEDLRKWIDGVEEKSLRRIVKHNTKMYNIAGDELFLEVD